MSQLLENNETTDRLIKILNNLQLKEGEIKLIIFLGLLGDFDSFEYCQQLISILPLLKQNNIQLYSIAIGTEKSKNRFCNYIGYPHNSLIMVQNNNIHRELQLCNGMDTGINHLLDLLLMCAGIGSPGTLKEVLRGYIGDQTSKPLLPRESIIRNNKLFLAYSYLLDKTFGKGFQRPFELATVRLINMTEILNNWNIYVPYHQYLTQRGGTFIINNENKLIYSYRARSLLGYSNDMSNPLQFLSPYIK